MGDIKPASTTRCQVDITPEHGPFVLGPPPREARCENKPVVILVEKDGDGYMAVCASCLVVAEEQEQLDSCIRVELTDG